MNLTTILATKAGGAQTERTNRRYTGAGIRGRGERTG